MPFDSAQNKPTKVQGLTSQEAKQRLARFGPNILPERPPPSDLVIFISQIRSPLVYVLLFAALVTATLGKIGDTTIILTAIFINTVLGFWQERRANQTLASLRQLVVPHAVVARDGKHRKIPLSDVVPGDIALLAHGEGVPADGEITEAVDLFVNEAILTGESKPAPKKLESEVFMGTVVAGGRGIMRVSATGASTEVGKIAQAVSGPAEQTPLKRQLHRLSKQLAALVGVLTVFVFTFGVLTGRPLLEMFLTAVALAVSAIPEGLLISTTAVLAIGMTKILKRRGLVRRLLAAETLGGVTVICVDKTGTLTEGIMRVVGTEGDKEWLVKATVLCNNLHDPFEVAQFTWAEEKIKTEGGDAQRIIETYPRVDEIIFSSREKYQAVLCHDTEANKQTLFVMGAPEVILEKCKMSRQNILEWEQQFKEYGGKGHRMVGFAYKEINRNLSSLSTKEVRDLVWIGILLFDDPVRAGVKEALEETQQAGVEVKVITGDYPDTARAVLDKLGLRVGDHEILLGPELASMGREELENRIPKIILFARTTPEQKLTIVETLKERGEIVAMTGDGVNDAPALSRADIGIVVGEASEVARESADLVLLDSNFSTIVAAIEEGRGIFDNLRKIVVYLLSDAFSEITTVVGTILLAFPLPLTAAQILWINLISDGFPNLALTVDPKRHGLMKESPRNTREQVVTRTIAIIIGTASVFSGILALVVFVFFYTTTRDLHIARSVAFLTLGVNSLLFVFSVRNLGEFILRDGWLANRWLVAAVGVGFFLQALPFYVPLLREFFGVEPLNIVHWATALGAGILVVFFIELSKVLFIKRTNNP
ncbi:HAD-IC family P-type ATPase [Candidatus Microgenomates bacterium]|nr:HAD-IC family P-type ATPase [Candidatus Microgenomates bacterium]